ncbi:MAG TPA: molybdate ABC transporter substrate-binding protein [Beijerinckiaceae bacterium]|jgi:molybdate transport system substrate-binding protein
MRSRFARILALLALVLPVSLGAQTADVTVFAAASVKNALDIIAEDFRRETGKRVAVSYGASSALARQIEQGAPADIFISADLDWMDYLERRNFISRETRHNLLGNSIVLIAPADQAKPVELKAGTLTKALGDGRLAVANVAAVPAGKYGKAALENLGLWTEVSDRLAQAENVRAALAFVSRGEAPLGIAYETDARADPKVAIVARFPATSHPPIVYPVAVTSGARSPFVLRFLDALRNRESAAIFAREGFTAID